MFPFASDKGRKKMKLELFGVGKKYSEKWALNDFTHTFQSGVYGILGSNGAGKSTLMNLLTDAVERTAGDILWNGKEILKLGVEYRADFGYMPQYNDSFSKLTVAGFLEYIGFLKGMEKKQFREQKDQLVEQLNIQNFITKKMCNLSGGMRQRVILAQAMLNDPKILYLDEPTAGLDPQERIRIRNLIMSLSKDRIILLATHIVTDIECIADQVLLLREGTLVAHGSPTYLIKEITPYVHEKSCARDELSSLQKEYPMGRVMQKSDGLRFRWVDDKVSMNILNDIGLEEVFIGVNNRWKRNDRSGDI